ncbi:MAG: hypothetical protein D6681_12910 [Calditrichaeota bacterium]|nr:MAG: hypothetical protein D6681_12910 [Calditrichota bacterium]
MKTRLMGISLILMAFSLSLSASNPDSTITARAKADPATLWTTIRGLEHPVNHGTPIWGKIYSALLFLPRITLDGLMYSTGYGAHLIDDTRFVEKIQDFLYLYKRRIGFYPIATFSSGTKIATGLTLFYRQRPFGAAVGAYYHGRSLWGVRFNGLYSLRKGDTVWQFRFSGKIKKRSDYEFHGLGPNPHQDPRNAFRSGGKDFGLFAQRLVRIQISLGLRPARRWEIFYTGMYQERRISLPHNPDPANLDQVFDLRQLPGAPGNAPRHRQIYQELTVRFDTRKYRGQISPGIRLEGYGGISTGISSSRFRFLRDGVDAALYIPVLKQTRLIVPRIIFDQVINLRPEEPIPFTEYPRQPAFRGVSTRTLLRSDEISLLPSVEYQWPLGFSLRAHLFVDYLIVGDAFSRLTLNDAPYAYGFAIDLHGVDSETARISIANGSEGIRVLFTVGLSHHSSDRTQWQ